MDELSIKQVLWMILIKLECELAFSSQNVDKCTKTPKLAFIERTTSVLNINSFSPLFAGS